MTSKHHYNEIIITKQDALERLRQVTKLAENRKKAIKSLIIAYDKQAAKLYRQNILQNSLNSANKQVRELETRLKDTQFELNRRMSLHQTSLEEIVRLEKLKDKDEEEGK